MLPPIITTWVSIEGHRRLVQVIPDPVQKWWDKWELRGLVLVSLVSQVILTLLGNRRRYRPNIWTRPLVWCAYLLADWVAAVAMGVISSNLGDYYNKGEPHKNFDPQLIAFWAPFFLMHLGGPDSITAYSLEDNDLWLRHLVGLLTQTALTVYIILMSWKGNWLSHLSILMLIIGFIKYGERTWSLYCGSTGHLRDSFLRSIDSPRNKEKWLAVAKNPDSGRGDKRDLRLQDPRAFLGFMYIFVSLFVDLVLSPFDITRNRLQFQDQGGFGYGDAFGIVNEELKLMYDVFYAKAFANYGVWGFFLRLITLPATIVVLVLYTNLSKNNEHLVVDRIITHFLLVGALISEIYGFISLVISSWTMHYFLTRGLGALCILHLLVDAIAVFYGMHGRVEISVGQSNFLPLICNKNWNLRGGFFPVNKLEKLVSVSHSSTYGELQYIIFNYLHKKSEGTLRSGFSGTPGYRHLIMGLKIPIFACELEFHRTIITWHIATGLFYYSDQNHEDLHSSNTKEISDYMLYLLVKQRYMLPVGAGLVTLRDTIVESIKIFEDMKVVPLEDNLTEACRLLLQQSTPSVRDDETTEMQSTSVLFHACEIAKELIARDRREMWGFLEELWVEIISYASAHCRVDMHAQQLRRGPEFLSYVWLLQAHLGLLEQFQVTPRQVNIDAGSLCEDNLNP